MKSLVFTLVFLFSGLSLAANYSFKESHFSVAGLFKKTSPEQAPVPAFNFTGSALVSEDSDDPRLTKAQITIRRTTYDCDDVVNGYQQSQYSCVLSSAKLFQILDEVATRQAQYDASIEVLRKYFNNPSYSENYTIPIGSDNQPTDEQITSDFEDPTGSNATVQTTIINSGLTPL